MAYRIVGEYKGKKEVLEEEVDTLKETERLCSEYRMAFGQGWKVYWLELDCKGGCLGCTCSN